MHSICNNWYVDRFNLHNENFLFLNKRNNHNNIIKCNFLCVCLVVKFFPYYIICSFAIIIIRNTPVEFQFMLQLQSWENWNYQYISSSYRDLFATFDGYRSCIICELKLFSINISNCYICSARDNRLLLLRSVAVGGWWAIFA